MKRIWILIALLALLLAGCTQKVPETTASPTTTVPTPTAAPEDRYTEARLAIAGSKNLVLEYTVSEERVVGENRFTKKVEGDASFSNINRTQMTAIVEETLDFGAYSCSYAEAYCKGKAYAVVNDCRFGAALTPEDFVDRQIPAVLITESLYETVVSEPGADTVLIRFSDPVALESWVGEGELISASGTALLDKEGHLLQTEYQVEYTKGQVSYKMQMTVAVKAPKTLDLSAVHIAHDKESIQLTNLDGPRALVQTVADVYAAQRISCEIMEVIDSEAIPLRRSQKTELRFQGKEETLEAETSYTVSYMDYRGEVTEKHQAEHFRDGIYSISVDGGEASENSGITATAMRQYCEDTVLSGLFAMKYLKDVTVEETDGDLRFVFAGNEAFCADLMFHLSSFLQVDLDSQAQSMETLTAGGYLTVDGQTGLPVGMGMHFDRYHTMNSVRYKLSYSLDETLTFVEE